MIGPNIKFPIGIVPPKAMNHNDNTRARISSSRRLCKIVMRAVVVEKYDAPRKNPVMNARGVERTEANGYAEGLQTAYAVIFGKEYLVEEII